MRFNCSGDFEGLQQSNDKKQRVLLEVMLQGSRDLFDKFSPTDYNQAAL